MNIRQSMLNSYKECPYKCKCEFGTLTSAPLFIREDNGFYAELGILVHELLEVAQQDKSITLDDLYNKFMELYNVRVIGEPVGKKNRGDYLNIAYEMLEYYFLHYGEITPKLVEWNFSDLEIEGIEHLFTGTMDRVTTTGDEEVHLWDWKTGSSSKYTKADLQGNIQATIYTLAYYNKFKVMPKTFNFVFLQERRVKTVIITPQVLQNGIERITTIIKEMEVSEFNPNPKGGQFFCKNFCDFIKNCPRYAKAEDEEVDIEKLQKEVEEAWLKNKKQ